MQKEPNIQKEVEKLAQLLSEHETIVRYKELEQKVQNNRYLEQLMETIKTAQKEAANFSYYGKFAAEKETVRRIEQLTKTFDRHPIVAAYRKQLIEANELLHHLTNMLQDEINEWIEEEGNASKN
ncbi:YlbF family regulator [Enterococcus ratti]|uniref:YlbF family regulator n=1 Tax=Enterococcus ratti TaxID=150033 RepID=A0A1L8WAM2_9ENTE|nr:YlbF family regulator [Enterococcus ratti]OJG78088.1 hypothetical protein RV14_GL001237 [Enterococcus ratti]